MGDENGISGVSKCPTMRVLALCLASPALFRRLPRFSRHGRRSQQRERRMRCGEKKGENTEENPNAQKQLDAPVLT
jgi:hypothetical protein